MYCASNRCICVLCDGLVGGKKGAWSLLNLSLEDWWLEMSTEKKEGKTKRQARVVLTEGRPAHWQREATNGFFFVIPAAAGRAV